MSSNLCLMYFEVAEKNPRHPAFISDRWTVDHQTFSTIVRSFIVKLSSIGVSRDSIVAFRTEDMMASLALIFASSWIGARLVVDNDRLMKAGLFRATHFVKSKGLSTPSSMSFIDIDETWFSRAFSVPGPAFSPDDSAQHAAVYLTSSGTSGEEKLLQVSHAAMRSRVLCRREEFTFRHTVLASPATATSRLLWARALPVLMQAGAVAVGYSPKFWLDAGVSRVVGSPQQVTYLFKGVELPRRFECLEVGGAPLNTHMVNLFLNHFDKVIDSYGAVETSKSYENVYTKVSGAISVAGRQVDSDVEIVDERGCSVPIGTPGTVRVRNAHIADGYVLTTGLAAVRSDIDGWFYPGDIAAWGGNGTLKVLGRIDQVINIGGAKILAGELEDYVNQFAYIIDVAVVQFLDAGGTSWLRILVEVDGTNDVNSVFDNICRYAAKEKGILMERENFIVVDKIARNINGKIDVLRCVEFAKSQLMAS